LIHRAILGQGARHLHGDDDAGEESDEDYDRQTADTDDVHLEQDVALVMGRPENIAQGAPGQYAEILEGRNGRLQEIEQTGSLILMMLPRPDWFLVAGFWLLVLEPDHF
jgi:hypothetical protein